jgi:hypothetical protein
MKRTTLEAQILRQLTYYPQFRANAALLLKSTVFEGTIGQLKHADIYNYIIKNNPEPEAILLKYKGTEAFILLTAEDACPYLTTSYSSMFVLLEMYLRGRLKEIIANFPPDHFREECTILINSELDIFETITTLKNFLSHYQHQGHAAIEELDFVLDEKIQKIKNKHQAYQQLQQVAQLLAMHYPQQDLDALFQPIYQLC